MLHKLCNISYVQAIMLHKNLQSFSILGARTILQIDLCSRIVSRTSFFFYCWFFEISNRKMTFEARFRANKSRVKWGISITICLAVRDFSGSCRIWDQLWLWACIYQKREISSKVVGVLAAVFVGGARSDKSMVQSTSDQKEEVIDSVEIEVRIDS